MEKVKKNNLIVKGIEVNYKKINQDDYICLTDIAKVKNSKKAAKIIENWMRNRMTIEYLGLWEIVNNEKFKVLEFEEFKKECGLNSFFAFS